MSIPKIAHYCWFGSKARQSPLIRKCIGSFALLCGYEIVEWNDSNCDLASNEYASADYQNGRFAFLSDYVRLKKLYELGGIYFDTDVEIRKGFRESFLDCRLLLSFMHDCNLSTAVIGCEAGNSTIKKLLDEYECRKSPEMSPNNDRLTSLLLAECPDFRLNNKAQFIGDGIRIFPKEYFECPTASADMGFSVHHSMGSWYRDERSARSLIRKSLKGLMGDVLYSRISRHHALTRSPFYKTYLMHKDQ